MKIKYNKSTKRFRIEIGKHAVSSKSLWECIKGIITLKFN